MSQASTSGLAQRLCCILSYSSYRVYFLDLLVLLCANYMHIGVSDSIEKVLNRTQYILDNDFNNPDAPCIYQIGNMTVVFMNPSKRV